MSSVDAVRFTRVGKTLVPADWYAEEFLDGVPDGNDVLLERSKTRSEKYHKWWEVAVGKAFTNLPEKLNKRWPNRNSFRDAIKIACGCCDQRADVFGNRYQVPRPLPGDYDEFKEFADLSLDVMSKILGIDVTTLMKETDKEARRK
jgi:hypothetical protein